MNGSCAGDLLGRAPASFSPARGTAGTQSNAVCYALLIAITRQDGFEVFTHPHRITRDGVASAPRLAQNGRSVRR